MKRILWILLLALILTGCASQPQPAQIAATTLPVYEFTARLCENTPLTVTRLVTEQVSCLHDYSLNVRQVKAAEAAQTIVISGGGLEDFMAELLAEGKVIDASGQGIAFHISGHSHDHDHEEHHVEDGHNHEADPHIWLSPDKAMVMVKNIRAGLSERYPQYHDLFAANEETLLADLEALKHYGHEALETLSCRELVTFHDGFGYLADSFHLTILEAVEEESGSEASARELIHLIELVEHHHLPAIFTEISGSDSAAGIISRETGAKTFQLDMAMAGDSYFDAMYHNINIIKEALQ